MKTISSICILLTVMLVGVVPQKAEVPVNVSMVQLIATPEKFDGKLISVIGFLRLEFEGNALYLHREDYEHGISRNGVWVDVSPAIMKENKAQNTSYVLLEGIFNSRDHGHMGMFSGAINKIRRAYPWQFDYSRK